MGDPIVILFRGRGKVEGGNQMRGMGEATCVAGGVIGEVFKVHWG